MSDGFWLIVELFGLLAAAALAAYSIIKLNPRAMMAAGTVGFCTWLLAGILSETEDPFERLGLLTLRVRVVDAETDEAVRGATIYVVATSESSGTTTYRLPASAVAADDEDPEVLTVSLFAQRRLSGSLYEQLRNPSATSQVVDQQLEIVAPGYQRWRGTLHQLLPDGWPTSAEPRRVVVALRR